MKYLKRYEKYNNNSLNELIVKYFNEHSEEIIEIIDGFTKTDDVENIMENQEYAYGLDEGGMHYYEGDIKKYIYE